MLRVMTATEPEGGMDRATQLALNALNQRFYASIASEWSDSRKQPWPGFERILQRVTERRELVNRANPANPTQVLRVLDLGCGDGRFAQFLADHAALRSVAIAYLGCDASSALLAHARGRELSANYHFDQADFVATPLSEVLPAGTFDLVCVLGVMHHIPGRSQRQRLVRTLSHYVAPQGLLALTTWRLDS
ncbi:MAG: hypothetical protein RL701_4599, partial [Pseudomonadota bacterium]